MRRVQQFAGLPFPHTRLPIHHQPQWKRLPPLFVRCPLKLLQKSQDFAPTHLLSLSMKESSRNLRNSA